MLFDLQSRGRRTVVKIIYLGLAVLMGGGLLLFGIGTGSGAGGFFDIFRNNGTSQSSQANAAEQSATRQVRLNPQDPRAWYALAYAHYQAAQYDQTLNGGQGGFTTSGKKKLVEASTAWQRYLKLDPQNPNATLAHLMANAYSQAGLNQPSDAASAMEIVSGDQPTEANYATLAEYAYLAQQYRKGDLAAAKAIALAPAAQQRLLRNQLANIRRQVLQQAARSSSSSGAINGTG
jgi:outer membrane protein assembly factor BamD (BamD/ComL family)